MRLHTSNDSPPFGIGLYTVADAARLLRIPRRNIQRWLEGYPYKARDGARRAKPPLWQPQLPADERRIELGFRDLIELRFVSAFLDAGLGLFTIRSCLVHAREFVGDDHPFSTRLFRTDGRTIFYSFVETAIANPSEVLTDFPNRERAKIVDLRTRNYVFPEVIERTFKDLDIEANVVTRWRPFRGKGSIVIDPKRSFGEPIATETGVPTSTIADAVAAEGSEKRVAAMFNIERSAVADAVAFERELAAA
jgi:uncharacterized protein (DUF433 family)